MKIKLTLLLFGLFIKTFGQVSTKVYLDEFGFPVEGPDNAKSYRIIYQHPIESNKFLVKEYYLNDITKQTGTFSDKEIFIKDGFFISFYPNGQKSEEGFFKENAEVGMWSKWYQNGQICEESFWDNSKGFYQRQKVENFWDSLGNKLAT